MSRKDTVWEHLPVATDQPPEGTGPSSSTTPATPASPDVSAVTPPTPPTPVTPTSPISADHSDEDHAQFAEDFDPEAVPPFPVLNADIRPPGLGETVWIITTQGVRERDHHATTADQARQVAIDRLSQIVAQRRGVDAIRATITEHPAPDTTNTENDGEDGTQPRKTRWIIGAQGETFDVDQHHQAATAADRDRSRRWKIRIAAAAAALVVLGTGVTAGVVIGGRQHSDAPVAAPPPPAPAQPVELPGSAPAGLSSHATWASDPVEGPATVLPDGRILAPTDAGIAFIDPKNGRTTNTIATRTISEGPWVVSIDGRDLVAWTTGGQTLAWTDLADPAHTITTTPLPTSTEITATASGIAWPTGATTFEVLTPTGPQQRTGPANSTIAGVTGPTLWLTNDLGQAWRITDGSAVAPDPLDLDRPEDTHAKGIITVTNRTLVAGWTANDGTATYTLHNPTVEDPSHIIDTITEDDHGNTSGPLKPLQNDAITDPAWVPVRGGLLDLTTRSYVLLPDNMRHIDAALDDRIWATTNTTAWIMDTTTGETHHVPRPSRPVPPVALSDDHTLVLAENGTDTRLYALPTTN